MDDTTTTYTRAQVITALGTMHGQLDAVTETSPVDQLTRAPGRSWVPARSRTSRCRPR